MPIFDEMLSWGQDGEELVARYLLSRGCSILFSRARDNGPQRMYTPLGPVVAPDLLAIKRGVFWVECKRKDRFEWHRKGGYWYTGIDTPQYDKYCALNTSQPIPVYLFLLHEHSYNGSPTGLYGGALGQLSEIIFNRFPPSANGRGLVMWRHQDLPFIAALEEVQQYAS